jgi:hypothetical protein
MKAKEEREQQAGCTACLSMHQPWASLLVHGIKRIEGRSWATDHRGWLWIASTAQEPEQAAIEVCLPGKAVLQHPFMPQEWCSVHAAGMHAVRHAWKLPGRGVHAFGQCLPATARALVHVS